MDLHRFLRRVGMATLAAAATGATACGEKTDPDDKAPVGSAAAHAGVMAGPNDPREPVMTAESQALLQAGNVAFRRKDYVAALAAYEKAAKGSPDHPAPWMGIYMVARVRNDTKAMDAAQAELSKRNPGPSTEPPAPDAAAARAPAGTGVGTVKN